MPPRPIMHLHGCTITDVSLSGGGGLTITCCEVWRPDPGVWVWIPKLPPDVTVTLGE